jgi:hypothetical protein
VELELRFEVRVPLRTATAVAHRGSTFECLLELSDARDNPAKLFAQYSIIFFEGFDLRGEVLQTA